MKNKLLGMMLLLGMLILFAGQAEASFCTPRSGYTGCIESTYLDANPKIHYNNVPVITYENEYYAKSALWDIYCDGTRTYLTNERINYLSCTSYYNGCSNFIWSSNSGGAKRISLSTVSSDTILRPSIACWHQGNQGATTASMTFRFYGDIKPTWNYCSSDSNCKANEICDNSNPMQVECTPLVCGPNDVIQNHACFTPEMPYLCTEAGINDYYNCQNYLGDYMDILYGDLNEKVRQIDQLNIAIEEKVIIINTLTHDLEEKVEIVNQLTTKLEEREEYISLLATNVEEQTQMVAGLENTLAEKVIIVSGLQTEIATQVEIINGLTSNLAEKAEAITLLTSENTVQAELILLMEESFSKQADIVNALNLTVQEDADLIGELNLSITDQAKFIEQLNLKLEDEAKLVAALQMSNEEQAQTIALLSKNLEETQAYIQELKDSGYDFENEVEKLQKTNQRIKIALAIVAVTLIGFAIYFSIKKKLFKGIFK